MSGTSQLLRLLGRRPSNACGVTRALGAALWGAVACCLGRHESRRTGGNRYHLGQQGRPRATTRGAVSAGEGTEATNTLFSVSCLCCSLLTPLQEQRYLQVHAGSFRVSVGTV